MPRFAAASEVPAPQTWRLTPPSLHSPPPPSAAGSELIVLREAPAGNLGGLLQDSAASSAVSALLVQALEAFLCLRAAGVAVLAVPLAA